MGKWSFLKLKCPLLLLFLLALSQSCIASLQRYGTIPQGFGASQMGFIDRNGLFLLSKDSSFAFGFSPTSDVTLFLLVILHQGSSTVVWTANTGTPVVNSDNFAIGDDGSVTLKHDGKVVWQPDTGGKAVSAIELQDSGNLVMYGKDNSTIVWESFRHPTDTLLPDQDFVQGMQLSSNPDPEKSNLTYRLQIKSDDIVLSSGYKTPQVYWSMKGDKRETINKNGVISSAKIVSNSWNFYDDSNALIWQFVFSSGANAKNSSWIAVLGSDGFLHFYSFPSKVEAQNKIPNDPCGRPEPCEPYLACSSTTCLCPTGLVSRSCKTGISDPCRDKSDGIQLVNPGDGLGYFALAFTQPFMKSDLDGCKDSCSGNCSCLGLFFDNSSRNCFLFDRIGSFMSDPNSKYSVFVKVSTNGDVGNASGDSNGKHLPVVITIVILTVVFVSGLIYGAYWYHKKKKKVPGSPEDTSEEDNFLGSLSGMPVRFSYQSLQDATNNFSVKLGQGGFGSVYKGKLPDGTPLAVKKLEGVGQGKKEFRAEVCIIGSIHHIHLVRLRGFCTEGSHRLLAYEFMANGSLDKWIFKRNKDNTCLLDWSTRFNIAVGTAKGLAYLHEDCEVKIVHCDIKPENVLLDEHFEARVSDFGLAKLMTREQSHVFTTLRGTRGYLAPEWITNYAISEKSDVYSYGMVLLELIGGRKNFDPSLSSEKSHFPAYAFKMMEEGKLNEIFDSNLKYDPDDERVTIAIKVALWCIQEDMSMRPPMTKVVQMLEGICAVPEPPVSSLTGARLFSSFFKLSSSEGSQGTGTGSSSGPSEWNSENYMSAVRLSGPR